MCLILGTAIWAGGALLLSLPWALCWCSNRSRAFLLSPIALLLGIVPPLGLIGVACPLAAAGLLFPGTGWLGLAVTAMLPGAIAAWPRTALTGLLFSIIAVHAVHPGDPQPPLTWEGINTVQGPMNGIVGEYQAIDSVFNLALNSRASVIVFPEAAVSRWTDMTDAFWAKSIAELGARGKTILVGSTVTMSPGGNSPQLFDFSNEMALLGGAPQPHPRLAPRPELSYRNVVVIRGLRSGLFAQRIPVPIGMWKPFSESGVPLNVSGPAVLEVGGRKAAILICYEQLLAWPILTSMVQRPTILVGIANDHPVRETPISTLQSLYLSTWARLFSLPLITATNR